MGWEIWFQEDEDNDRHLFGFFSNTTMQSFGPVFSVDYNFDKSNFYKLWDSAFLGDPRFMEAGELEENTKWIKRISNDYEDIATANLKIFKVKPNSAPYLIHEDNIVSSYDMLSFSPYKETLENLSTEDEWEDFDAVHDIVEQLNEDMKDGILKREEKTTSWLENVRHGFRGEISWKVLDE